MSEDNLLEDLLLAAEAEIQENCKNTSLVETDLFAPNSDNIKRSRLETASSLVHSGDTDSSDDEGNKNFETQKYNECGKFVRLALNSTAVTSSAVKSSCNTWKSKPKSVNSNTQFSVSQTSLANKGKSGDVYADPIFGIRIINPLISSTVLKDRMVGREPVQFSKLKFHLQSKNKDKDWVIAGVIANKTATKTSQKGSQFCIWTLSDLHGDIKTVSMFLFSGAYKQLWKTAVGTVVGILNPNVLDKKDGSKDEACLSVDNAQKVMILGQSKDFGTCRSIKKNGEQCNAIVNMGKCEFCIYHIKQEYQKCSRRSELQANFSGKGLTALRNKVLGKNEVFYGGKSYMAIPAKKNRKLEKKDEDRLLSLKGLRTNSTSVKGVAKKKQAAARLEISQAQRLKDLEILKKLGGTSGLESKTTFTGTHSSDVTLEESKNNALNVIAMLKAKNKDAVLVKKPKMYDANLDLIAGMENNNSFDGKVSTEVTLDESRNTALNVISKLKAKNGYTGPSNKNSFDANILNVSGETRDLNNFEKVVPSSPHSPSVNTTINSKTNGNLSHQLQTTVNIPTLSGFGKKSIDLSKPITTKGIIGAKLNAIKYIEKHGQIKKVDPNSIKSTLKKRPLDELNKTENDPKKQKIEENEFISDRFKKMMAATSKHGDLLQQRDDEEQEKYFNKLELKEKMEEKMATTYKVACKAVRCLNCKYTSFSAADLCKAERHTLKVFDAMKRFFKCGNCSKGICCLEIVPTRPCINCGSGKWERTGMMKEKIVVATPQLSIRGGEQKFINSVATDSNINLMVPDE